MSLLPWSVARALGIDGFLPPDAREPEGFASRVALTSRLESGAFGGYVSLRVASNLDPERAFPLRFYASGGGAGGSVAGSSSRTIFDAAASPRTGRIVAGRTRASRRSARGSTPRAPGDRRFFVGAIQRHRRRRGRVVLVGPGGAGGSARLRYRGGTKRRHIFGGHARRAAMRARRRRTDDLPGVRSRGGSIAPGPLTRGERGRRAGAVGRAGPWLERWRRIAGSTTATFCAATIHGRIGDSGGDGRREDDAGNPGRAGVGAGRGVRDAVGLAGGERAVEVRKRRARGKGGDAPGGGGGDVARAEGVGGGKRYPASVRAEADVRGGMDVVRGGGGLE